MQDTVYWIWLSLSLTPGRNTLAKLMSEFSSAKDVYDAEEYRIISCIGSKCAEFPALSDKNLERAEKILDFCLAKGVGILTYADSAFPESLRRISNPPAMLYYRGVLPDFNKECFISMVGTRRLTDYGRRNAFTIGSSLAKAGAVVVSGMAIGVDGVSMAGALSEGGKTVAVIGSGIDVCYPECHKRLAREIVKSGCVITEYAPGTRPDKQNFPRRNRIISGLCCATVVIEGRERSGALITAKCAKEQNRAVYALPGNVDIKTSEVSNLLIKNGAKLITDAYDIVKDFEYEYLGILNPFTMAEPSDINMFYVLRELEVSCVAPSDEIFNTYPKKRKREAKTEKRVSASENADTIKSEELIMQAPEPTAADFDKNILSIYKKIPFDGDASIDALTDGENDVRKVMRALLKLEMGGFVEMLPGERVKRKIN